MPLKLGTLDLVGELCMSVWVSQRRCILNCQMFYNNDCSQRRTNGNHPPRNCARKKGRGGGELLGGRLSYKQNKQGLPRVKILRPCLGEEKKEKKCPRHNEERGAICWEGY